MPGKKKKKVVERKPVLPAASSPTDKRNEIGHTVVENAMCPDKKRAGGKPDTIKKYGKVKGKKAKEDL